MFRQFIKITKKLRAPEYINLLKISGSQYTIGLNQKIGLKNRMYTYPPFQDHMMQFFHGDFDQVELTEYRNPGSMITPQEGGSFSVDWVLSFKKLGDYRIAFNPKPSIDECKLNILNIKVVAPSK